MALGILDPEDFDPAIITLKTDKIRNLFFFSDGLIEQPDSDGNAFGMYRLLEIFKRYDYKESLVNQVFKQFTVFNNKAELLDDLSMCDLQVEALFDNHLHERKKQVSSSIGKITATFDIEGPLIASTDIVGCLDSIMANTDMVGDLRQRAFTVFAELVSNGLDHGILDLDSNLKNDFAGFADYLQLKEDRLENIGENAKLSMKFAYCPDTHEIDFEILDTGKGFDINDVKEVDDNALSGRGIKLIKKLCETVEVVSPGNKTLINLKRDF
jgi:hypothetical protein